MRTFYFHFLFLFTGVQASQAQWSTMQMDPGRVQITGIGNFDRAMAVGGFNASDLDNNDILDYRRGAGIYGSDLYLSEARYKIACAINGDLLFCAGGIRNADAVPSAMVEIFDLSTNSLLDEHQLTQARLELSGAAVGNKVLFAGGLIVLWNGSVYLITGSSAVVDIYDTTAHTWSTAQLSQERGGMASAVLGTKAYFAGGYQGNGLASDRVDIYDAATNMWTIGTLSQARAFFGGGAAVGNKVLFAGGTQELVNNSDRVDVYDAGTDTWSIDSISVARCGIQAAVTGNYAIFAGGGDDDMAGWSFLNASDVVDIYNASTDQWSTATMSSTRINFAAAASGNQVFLFGGVDETFANFPTIVDVFTDASTIGFDENHAPAPLNAWPDPFTDKLHIGVLDALAGCTAEVYDALGSRVASFRLTNTLEIDLSSLHDGLYQVRVMDVDGSRVLTSGPVVKTL